MRGMSESTVAPTDHATTAGRTFVGLISVVGVTFLFALAMAAMTYRGYGEDPVDGGLMWTLFVFGYVGAVSAALVIAAWLRVSKWLLAGVAIISGPPLLIASSILMLVAACSGVGPHSCAFS